MIELVQTFDLKSIPDKFQTDLNKSFDWWADRQRDGRTDGWAQEMTIPLWPSGPRSKMMADFFLYANAMWNIIYGACRQASLCNLSEDLAPMNDIYAIVKVTAVTWLKYITTG